MKKILRVAVFVIALFAASSANSIISPHSHNDEECINRHTAKDCYCSDCSVKLQYKREDIPKYVPCPHCGGDNRVNCAQQEWQPCSSCSGTGCKNGRTTDDGQYCAYGKCGYCDGLGGKYKKVMREACECTSFSCKEVRIENQFMGYGSIVYDFHYYYECPSCGARYSGC
jgi:hypothetical protein